MDFSTRCSKSPPAWRPDGQARAASGAAHGRLLRWALCCLVLAWGLGLLAPARAQEPHGEAAALLHVAPQDDGLYVSAALPFELPAAVEDALRKGVPMYFVAEAEVLRERWYWSDLQLAHAARYLRLGFLPLTHRWRLTMGAEPFSNASQGVTLASNFDSLGEALQALQRLGRWKIADRASLPAGAELRVDLRFRLDLSQLPRPLQIGVLGRSGWSLDLVRSARVRTSEH